MIALDLILRDPPYLQVAIDVTDLSKAVKIANAVAISEKVIIEAGTPLIKSVGIDSVRIFSQMFPNNIIFADMKTMDVGALEVEMALSAGAKIVSVLGAADEQTIIESSKKAKELGGEVQVDMISVLDPLNRAKKVRELGVNIVGLHAGIDQQLGKRLRGVDFIPLVKELKKEIDDIKISVAGGIKPDEAKKLAEAGTDIIVAGSFITNSKEPREATKLFLKELGINP
ncbi:MAG: geranylgeranylglyceryl/heptaprenylglyceryl phosphate synthase [Fervidicoccaceae archaeon]